MQVIILKGDQGKGKTTTLKLLLDLLIKNGAIFKAQSRNFYRWQQGKRAGDIWTIVEYNDKIIYISTVGDYPKLIEDAFKEARSVCDINIDIFICAAHTEKQVVTAFNRLGLKFDDVLVFDKSVKENNKETCNQADANDIFAKL